MTPTDYLKIYAEFLKKSVKPKRPMRVIFDCSNGTTGLVIKKISDLAIKNLEIILINDRPDGNFSAHGPDPMKEGAMDQLRSAVLRQKADLGVIFDADGDRAFFMDNAGRPVIADAVAALISKNYKGAVILDVRIGYLGRELIAADGKKVVDSKVGHYFIKKLMKEKKILFAGELSGHYYFNFPGGYYADSGIFSALQFINAVSLLKTSLSDWMDSLPKYFRSGEVNFAVKDKENAMKQAEKLYKARAEKISHLDGLKMEFGGWWFNLRPSNTEDLLRLNLEAKSESVFNREFAKIRALLVS